ncbi:methyl-accepting chemotaxis protein [Cereibacter sphaeroides]|nr:methyl-accepting chemotaxis protein [Cereibacter sphaeroides]
MKIIGLITVSTVVVVVANLFVSFQATTRMATEALHESASVSAGDFGFRAYAPVRFGDAARVADMATEADELGEDDLHGVVVVGADGAVMAAAGILPPENLEHLATMAAEAQELTILPGENGVFYVVAPVTNGGAEARVGGLAMHWTTEAALARAHANDWITVAIALGILAGMLVLSLFAVRHLISAPMVVLGNSLREIAEGNYDGSLTGQDRGDEIGDFARNVADLRDRLRIAQQDEEARERDHEEQVRVVSALREGLNALSQRDLTNVIDMPFDERYDGLRSDYNDTVNALRDTLRVVIDSVTRMREGAEDMTSSADNLSHRTETQAATLEETAAAIQQISTRVTETATNARKAEQIARGAQEKAQVSEPIVREAIEAMAAIQKRSSQIAQIITMIDDISFQTNLLALNAGVEAARAGDAGRGFAVVASEVRALAQRSSEAAREIKELVSGSTEQVNHGVELVKRSGSALSDFAGQVDDIASLMSVVAQASDDQAHSVTEINVGVSQLDSVTQQNAAMVQETTVAIHDLRQQAMELSSLLQNFDLGSGAGQRHTVDPYDNFQPRARSVA